MKKPTQNEEIKAVALSYEDKIDVEPKVVAKGKGLIAQQIIEKAKENNIPIQEDTALVELLGELSLNDGIPEELYQVIAEIFAFVYNMDNNLAKSKK